jgi:hypothetical protein
MNRLKKKAKTEFIASSVGTLITIPCFLFMSHGKAQGLEYLLIWVLAGIPTGLFLFLWEAKKLKQFDEREKEMIQKAFSVSMMVFSLYLLTFSLAAFFMIGGGGNIPVVFMPVMFFSGMFLAQAVQSFILLMQCAKEDNE